MLISYMISDGRDSFIRFDECSKKYVPVKSKAAATKWDQRSKAKNVLENAIAKAIRHRYKVIAEDEEFAVPVLAKVSSSITSVAEVTQHEKSEDAFGIHNDVVKSLAEREIQTGDTLEWIEDIERVSRFFINANSRLRELSQKLSRVEREIQDIHHFIELHKFNAYQGWLTSMMLKKSLKRRREIKDEILILSKIKGCSMTKEEIANVRAAASALENREYKPRVLTELFS